MRLISLAVAALPVAASAYTAHPMLLKAAEQQGCSWPNQFKIRNFVGQTNGTADAPSPSCFTFGYADAVTGVETTCQLNSTSKSTTPEGLTPRFACENRDVKFIWVQANSQLTIVERACPSPEGTPLYETAGSIIISAPCKGGQCAANSTEYNGVFTSLQPVRDPTSLKMAYEMMVME
ncbi:hypothetical protein LEL_03515 [Akanthomyces lecanii RCEF 1005]|uniref:Ricin B lectin n=1 Tax=Akanthomyces lecanii RCEF 1005 TaxID=1081108 RepID=A0A168J5H1_CORDF|nr:hypothetical protein LEL_03515 [Akanthomyces lecanii RCEF 1005]